MLKSESGVSAVEFALIAPLLFVLTFGIIEFGILLFDKAVVTNASREGARAAIVFAEVINEDGTHTYNPAGYQAVSAVVTRYTQAYVINLGGTSTPIVDTLIYTGPSGTGAPESGGDVTVRVRYRYDFLVFPDLTELIGGTFNGTLELVGTTVMRME